MNIPDPLQHARFLIDVGRTDDARQHLSQFVREHPANPAAWDLLASVVESPEEATYCRKRAANLRGEAEPPALGTTLRTTHAPEAPLEGLPPAPGAGPSYQPLPLPPDTPQATPPIPPERKGKFAWWLWVPLAACVIVACCVGVTVFTSSLLRAVENQPVIQVPAGRATQRPRAAHAIRYRVEGSGFRMADVSTMNGDGGTDQNKVNLPWSTTVTMRDGDFPYLLAHALGPRATITCIIEVDGGIWKRATSTGDFAFVTCAGILGQE